MKIGFVVPSAKNFLGICLWNLKANKRSDDLND